MDNIFYKDCSYGIAIFVSFLVMFFLFLIAKIKKLQRLYLKVQKSNDELNKKLNFFRLVLDAIPNPIFCKNSEGEYIEFNSKFENILGLSREEILNRKSYEVLNGDDTKQYHDIDMSLMKTKGETIYESKVQYADGKFHDIQYRKATLVSSDGKVEGLVSILLDITDLKKNEYKISRLLKINEDMLQINQSILEFENINDLFNLMLEKALSIINGGEYGSILILREDGILELGAFKGYDPEKIQGFELTLEHSFFYLKTKGKGNVPVIINDIYELDGGHIIDFGDELKNWSIKSCISTPIIINHKLYGMLNIDSNRKNAFTEDDAQVMQYIKSQIEIAINKHNLYKETVSLSKYDKLTGLYNRSYFDELLRKNFDSIVQNNNSFNLVIMDLNKLKFVNDSYGHIVGDQYISFFAKTMRKTFSSSDILARYGGDEFIGIFFNTNEECLTSKFEEMIKYFKLNPITFNGLEIICSFSYGISSYSDDSIKYGNLVAIADKKMYECKRNQELQQMNYYLNINKTK